MELFSSYWNTVFHITGGETRNIRPHSDFRVFFLSDPSLGEMSRAMRNRYQVFTYLSARK